MTCPNRDGLIDTRGCIFCSAGGSGDFAGGRAGYALSQSVDEQIIKAKELIAAKYNDGHYIAYFQSFTNTYADVSYLRNLYMPVISRNDIDKTRLHRRQYIITSIRTCFYKACMDRTWAADYTRKYC